ncbi:MAG TPA: peptidoglycan-binding protein [Kiloniellaceae bacterium]|nr:peptidoglycan-binding protein [Kiloniellaceae bacterium]
MTEHTDKPPQKPGMTTPRNRPGKRPAPDGRRASAPQDRGPIGDKASGDRASGDKAPGDKSSGGTATAAGAAPRSPLAPDPATVVFGSNRPIAAAPAKLPEGSGLRFTGPSAGVLKASGPQPASPKANGLTFTSAKAPPPKATPPKAKPAKGKKPEAKKPEAKNAEAAKAEAEKPALTKPAIAPQAAAPRFGKERSTGGFVAVMLALTVLGGGLAVWMKLSGEPASPQQLTAEQAAPEQSAPALPEAATPMSPPSPGEAETTFEPPFDAAPAPEPALQPAPQPAQGGLLTDVEIAEVQDLLSRLDFDPGAEHGVLTAATADAIRSYQEMAGLPADGEADRALLEELRSVAELYGS